MEPLRGLFLTSREIDVVLGIAYSTKSVSGSPPDRPLSLTAKAKFRVLVKFNISKAAVGKEPES